MKTILRILEKAGGYRRGLYLRVENLPHPSLVMEAMDESGPCGLPTLSVAQYSNALADPEMYFELSNPLGLGQSLVPFYIRNDRVGINQVSRKVEGDRYLFFPDLYDNHEKFAATWDNDLALQGFLAAFERGRTPR